MTGGALWGRALLWGVLFVAPLFLFARPALATPRADDTVAFAPTIAAVVDVQRILQESSAARSVQKQLENHRSKFQTQIVQEETVLRKAEQELAKTHGNVAPDIYADKEQDLRQKLLAVERSVQARRRALDQAHAESMNTIRNHVLDIVEDVAKAHGAHIVIVKQQILWADSKIEVTDEVLAKLNAKLPDVPVQIVVDPVDKVTPPREGGMTKGADKAGDKASDKSKLLKP